MWWLVHLNIVGRWEILQKVRGLHDTKKATEGDRRRSKFTMLNHGKRWCLELLSGSKGYPSDFDFSTLTIKGLNEAHLRINRALLAVGCTSLSNTLSTFDLLQYIGNPCLSDGTSTSHVKSGGMLVLIRLA